MKKIINNLCKKPLSEKFVLEFKNDLNWEILLQYQDFSCIFLDKVSEEFDKKWCLWYLVSKYQKLNTEFINKYNNSIFINDLFLDDSKTKYFSFKVIQKYYYKLDFEKQKFYHNNFKILERFQILWINKSYKYPTRNNPKGGCMYRLFLKNFQKKIKS